MNIEMIKRAASRGGLIVKKFSPEILLGVGIVSGIGATVLACKATLKADVVISEHKENLEKIHTAKTMMESGQLSIEEYSEQDYQKDLVIQYTQTTVKFFKLYGPALALGVLSIASILGAYGIMRKRNVAILAAFKACQSAFDDYRARVVEDLGEEKDKEYRYGLKSEKIKVEGQKEKQLVRTVDPASGYSQYARFFDESSREWEKSSEYNLTFLNAQQNRANDMLRARGHVYLNEVYDLLDIPRSKAGQEIGWLWRSKDDSYVDFGIYEVDSPRSRDFVNGYERSILLDFNCRDSVIDELFARGDDGEVPFA